MRFAIELEDLLDVGRVDLIIVTEAERYVVVLDGGENVDTGSLIEIEEPG